MIKILVLINLIGASLYNDLLDGYNQFEPANDSSVVNVGLDLWFLNQIDAVEQVFDVNLIVELEWIDTR